MYHKSNLIHGTPDVVGSLRSCESVKFHSVVLLRSEPGSGWIPDVWVLGDQMDVRIVFPGNYPIDACFAALGLTGESAPASLVL